jgi:uncharacterized membrane protein
MQDNTLRRITLAAVIASVVLVATMFLKVPTPTGYVHLGDGVIFAASLALGPTLGGLSAAIGSTLADILSAYAMWAPWTFFIKGGAGVIVGLAGNARTHRSHIAGMIAAAVWIVLGYAAGTAKLYSPAAVTGEILGNIVQTGSGIVIGTYLGPVLKNAVGRQRR